MEEAVARKPREQAARTGVRKRRFLLRFLRPQMGAAIVLWRIEAYSATPLALLFIATLGRWPGALAMGSIMAVFAAVFLYLLADDPVLDDIRAWTTRRRIGRAMEGLAERDDGVGKARRALALVPAVMILGPFSRAIAFHLFRMRRPSAYALSVGGSFPHALLWVGVILGSLWSVLIRPLLQAIWSGFVLPLIDWLIDPLTSLTISL